MTASRRSYRTRLSPLLARALLLALAPALSACVAIPGNGIEAHEVRDVTAFSRLDVSGGMAVIVQVDPDAGADEDVALRLSGDENLLDYVYTEVSDDALVVYTEGSLDPKLPLVLEVTVPHMTHVEVSGSSELKITGFDAESFELATSGSSAVTLRGRADRMSIETSGSSDIRVEIDDSERVDVHSSGSSDIELCGKTGHLGLSTSGSSDIDAHTMLAEAANIDSSGSSDILLCARESLHVRVSGSGDVLYLCDPEHVSVDISGSGDVSPG